MAYAERNARTKKLTGRWVCDAEFNHTDGSRTRWHKAFPSKSEAEGAEAYYRATGTPPPHAGVKSTKSFVAVAEDFKARNPEWVNAHGATNSQRLEFAITHLGSRDITAVRRQQLDRFVDTIKARCGVGGKPPSNRTINYYLDAVSKVLRYANDRDMLPMGMPTMPRQPNEGATREALTEALEKAVCGIVLAKGDRDSAFLIHVLAATGMRCGELYALRPEQFDDRGLSLRPSQTKTKHGRWVPLPPEAVTRLRAIIAAGKLPHRAHLYRIFKSAIELLGESSAYTLHCLRHTCVTRLLQRGVQKLDVGVLVGHRDKSVTSGYYHPSREHLTEQAKKAHNLLGEWLERAETAQAQVVDFAKAVEATAGIEPASTVLQTEKQYNHT